MDHKKFTPEFTQNKRFWDEAASIHLKGSDVYRIEAFIKGECSLMDIELKEVGDVNQKDLLHLQCHFGMDTLSWARMGANVTGVDFSVNAIEAARRLASQTGINGHFIVSNIYDIPHHLDKQYDIVYSTYGAYCWPPDLHAWAKIIYDSLKEGGFFYIADFHPVRNCIALSNGKIHFESDYFGTPRGVRYEAGPDYANMDVQMAEHQHEWQHTLAEIVTALAQAGLRIQFVHEFPKICFNDRGDMQEHEKGWYRFSGDLPSVPLTFSIKAIKA